MAAVQNIQNGAHQIFDLCQAAFAEHATGQVTAVRRNDRCTTLAQDVQICLRGRMLPHLHIHGGRNNQRRGSSQRHGGQEIVGHAVCQARQDVGGRGRDD